MSEVTRQSRRSLIGFAVALMLGAALAMVMSRGTTLLDQDSEAPPFELSSLEGDEPVSLESLRGKLVLVDFWSSSCPPCVRQMRDLEVIHQRLSKQDVVVLGINTEGANPDFLREFSRKRGVRYKVLIDRGAVMDSYHVTSLPTLYLIDRQGKIRWSNVGYTSHQVLETRIRELI
jgi:peroxiredoxin